MARVEIAFEVDCVGGGTPHHHTIVVSCDEGVYNVGPTRRKLHYDCPTSGEGLLAWFDVPPEVGPPFRLERVT